MKVFWINPDTVLPREVYGSSIVIGNMDGVHKGHLLLIEKAREFARSHNVPFNILTFYPHPMLLFSPDRKPFALTPLRSKMRIFKELGADNVFLCKFNYRVASLTAEEYVDIFFRRIIKPAHIVIGSDHSFGKNRGGDAIFLKNAGFDTEVIQRDMRYSSSYIRELVEDGEMREVYKNMGRFYEVEDFVHHGGGMITKLGFYSASLYIRKYIRPRFGVYATKTLINGKWQNGICYFQSSNPENKGDVLENHVFNFDKDLYGKRIRIIFIDYIRNEITFNDIKEAKIQFKKDIFDAKSML